MTAGRPTKYDPAFCDAVIQHMADGFSKTATAGLLGVCKSTFDNWCDEHEEFLGAVKVGETLRTAKLERDLIGADTGPLVTSRIFALKNAAPHEWRDRKDVDITSSDGSMTPRPGVDLSKLSDQALAELIAARDASTDPKD
jgi:transposase-like protein